MSQTPVDVPAYKFMLQEHSRIIEFSVIVSPLCGPTPISSAETRKQPLLADNLIQLGRTLQLI